MLRALGPWSKAFVRERSLRVALFATGAGLAAFLGSVAAPLFLLAWTPLVLGVPHLLSDLRYLVVRPGLHRRPALLVPLGLSLLAIVLLAPVPVSLAATATAILIARAPVTRRLAGLTGVGACTIWCVGHPLVAPLALAQLHNLVAVALWWRWRPRRPIERVAPVLFVCAITLLLCGFGERMAHSNPLMGDGGSLNWMQQIERLAPGIPSPFGVRLVLVFAFAQAFHYAVWLRLLPEDDRPRPTPRTFAASWRALREDFGLGALALTGALALGLGLWGLIDLPAAGNGYLRLALFHGPLEFAIIGNAWAERRRLSEGVAP